MTEKEEQFSVVSISALGAASVECEKEGRAILRGVNLSVVSISALGAASECEKKEEQSSVVSISALGAASVECESLP